MLSIRTDLATEAYEMLTEAAQELAGICVKKDKSRNFEIARVEIETADAAKQMGKPIGKYITMEIPDTKIADKETLEALCHTLSDEIKALADLKEQDTVLVVGLGNRSVTPDALGPQVVSNLMVTRHMLEYIPEHIDEGIRPVCAVSPGVLGITGIETGEIVRGVTDKIKPDLVICVDALAARSMNRINRTIQLCDTGIAPGAGVGNKRHALNKETLGIPVIAIGVPTVIDAATITSDSLDAVSNSIAKAAGENSKLFDLLSSIDKEEQLSLIKEAISDDIGEFIVTPKDVDLIIEKVAKVVADGINLAMHENIGFDEIEMYVS